MRRRLESKIKATKSNQPAARATERRDEKRLPQKYQNLPIPEIRDSQTIPRSSGFSPDKVHS